MMYRVLLIGIGGALGSVMRFGVSGLTYRVTGGTFPAGTMAVNLIGAFAAGFLWELVERAVIPSHMRSFIFVGILGGFTTFSTFGLESFNLLRDGEIKIALYNMVLSNVLCIVLVFAGFAAAKSILK